ncbi:MAG: geopeptide radical SAM maturase [Desulfuromonadaceae bacterium]|nr:geopeptide radical SAM maturase [Desulfuromonadaceae bacterium]MDD2849087.1 geopeptide radical SAM maturase [Desulfuromonadaceae bacterium]MDD4131755.1 geopeptide radical SAM maturase [Desulfuromonadaceae bacterium]
MPLSRYLKIYPDPDRPGSVLLYSTRKGSVVRVSEALLADARAETLAEADCSALRRLEMWVDDAAAEREMMAALVDHTNSRSGTFAATVVLTLDCNLACPYCFEDHFRGDHALSAETARLLVAHVKREQIDRGRDVELRFYGGEPLMAVPRLKEIAGPLRDAAALAGTKFSCSLVTNATLLTRPVVEELLPFGLQSAQITLDGPEETHNSQRPFVSGRGSFSPIVANLRSVYDLITIKPGGNFTRDNYHEFPAMLDALLAAGIDPVQLGPVQFAPIHPKSGGHDPHSAACVFGSEAWLIEANLFLRKETLRRGFSVEKPHMGVCMIELTNSLVVAYDGTLYKCPPLMGWPEFAIGTLVDGISDYRQSHNLGVWKNDECLECAYLPLCFGGCRFFNKLKTGSIDGVDCRRAMLDASLETIIRQDLGLE